jgi:hypothetical protein
MNDRGEQEVDVGSLFGQVLEAVTSHREEINTLDGYNGNHGDNMVENIGLIARVLQENTSLPPADALRRASERLQSDGRGGTSKYYAEGLSQAASQFQDRSILEKGDVLSLVQTLMSAIPAEGHPQQSRAAGSVLDVLGLLGGQQGQSQSQPQPQEDDGVDMGDVLETLLPAGMAFLQAKQSGADTKEAAGQALMGALMSGQENPFQADTPRAAAGGVVVQSLLKALIK